MLRVSKSAVVVPSGATVALAVTVPPLFTHAALSNCSLYVSRLARACSVGREALVGWIAVGGGANDQGGLALPFLYAGTIAWVIGYDTIYAHQDRADDLFAGIKSTALLFGASTRRMLMLLYGAAVALIGWLIARWVSRPLGRLEDGAVAVGAGDLTTRVAEDDGPPEVRALAHRFNRTAFGWGIEYPRQFQAAYRMGLDGVYSDHPDRMVDSYRAQIGGIA